MSKPKLSTRCLAAAAILRAVKDFVVGGHKMLIYNSIRTGHLFEKKCRETKK